jgi:branched-chain amino acid:cation transporter, LIVCS family
MGASSVEKLGYLDNGGEVLASVSNYYFGTYGGLLLGLMITVACLTTSVGLITSCSSYFHKFFPNISYKKIAITLSIFSAIVANVGLNQLISFSVPVLSILYPLAIVLIFLTFAHSLFNGKPEVYQGSLLLTFIVSFVDGLSDTSLRMVMVENIFNEYLPFYQIGLGWILPAIVGGLVGNLSTGFKNVKALNYKIMKRMKIYK